MIYTKMFKVMKQKHALSAVGHKMRLFSSLGSFLQACVNKKSKNHLKRCFVFLFFRQKLNFSEKTKVMKKEDGILILCRNL